MNTQKILQSFFMTALVLSFFSCTTTNFTKSMVSMSRKANATGNEGASAILNATASISNAADTITPENEYYIGRAVAATILTHYKVYNAPAKEAYLNEICRVITENSDKSEIYNGYHVKILDSNEVNAFSTSGGHILLTRGILKCARSEDALAAVIAHEVAHIHLQHSLKAVKSSRIQEAFKDSADALVTAVASKAAADKMNEVVGDTVSTMIKNGYSQSQEYDADKRAVQLMYDAGYDPYAMNDMLSKMSYNQKGSKIGFYKTHPSPEKRMKKLKSVLKNYNYKNSAAKRLRQKRFKKIMG